MAQSSRIAAQQLVLCRRYHSLKLILQAKLGHSRQDSLSSKGARWELQDAGDAYSQAAQTLTEQRSLYNANAAARPSSAGDTAVRCQTVDESRNCRQSSS